MTSIIILNFIAFFIGVYSFLVIRKKKINEPLIKYLFLSAGIILLTLYLIRTFGNIYFKGIYTQEILLFSGISAFFLAMRFGITGKYIKKLNLILLFLIFPILNQFLYVMLSAVLGIVIYNDEKILFAEKNFKVVSQSQAPGMSAQENILVLRPKTKLIETQNSIHIMRYSEDSLKFKLEHNKVRIMDISKWTKFDTIIK